MELTTAVPIEAPIVRMLAFMPLAAPVWASGTLCTMREVIEAYARPMPTPKTAADVATSHGGVWAKAKAVLDAAASRERAITWARLGNQDAIGPLSMPATAIVASIGTMSRPASPTEEPKP